MSGGVDSSVSAYLLKEEGYDVFGIMLRLWTQTNDMVNRCCSPSAVNDAREIADILDIPFYVLDYNDFFKTQIVDQFTNSYLKGVTPNPCVYCNKKVRFGRLMDEAIKLGADYLATGHYVRREELPDNTFRILRGIDPQKDQSYMLYRLDQRQISHALFPVGSYKKDKIREIARQANLPVFAKGDSQDLCFFDSEGLKGFLGRQAPLSLKPGDIVLNNGTVVGQHQGLPLYTVGQRRGLNIPWSEPLFVLGKNSEKNELIVGAKNETGSKEFTVKDIHFSKSKITPDMIIQTQTRYRGDTATSRLTMIDADRGKVTFDEPINSPTPGQSAVFYQQDTVIGGAIIDLN